jgi:hypothetical protein
MVSSSSSRRMVWRALKCILSRIYGCVSNNNGFWIGWLDLLTASFTISHNHKLQEITVNLQSNPSSLTAKDSLHSLSGSTAPSNWTTLLYPLGTDHTQKTHLLYCCLRVCWGSHMMATQPVHWRAGCCLATVSARTIQKTTVLYF